MCQNAYSSCIVKHCFNTQVAKLACTIQLFDLNIILCLSEHNALDVVVNTEHKAVTNINPTLEFIYHVLPEKEVTFNGPHPCYNHFEDPCSFVSSHGDVALHVMIQLDCSSLLVREMQTIYNLSLTFYLSYHHTSIKLPEAK